MTRPRILLISALIFATTHMMGWADIYKWKDKNGVTRYTDTPPPSDTTSYQTLSRKASKPAQAINPTADEARAISNDMAKQKVKSDENSPEAQAEKRRQIAEAEKRNKAEKEAEDKRRALNCNAAKANAQAYGQGGRIYKTNPQGEREYLGDEELQAGIAQAQREMQENCH